MISFEMREFKYGGLSSHRREEKAEITDGMAWGIKFGSSTGISGLGIIFLLRTGLAVVYSAEVFFSTTLNGLNLPELENQHKNDIELGKEKLDVSSSTELSSSLSIPGGIDPSFSKKTSQSLSIRVIIIRYGNITFRVKFNFLISGGIDLGRMSSTANSLERESILGEESIEMS
ncbi:hypothetical protein Tco_0169257 [Tanacetum coccineum]